MPRRRTVFIYNTTYVNGEHVRIGRMLVGARIALGLMTTGIAFLTFGIIMKVIDDEEDSPYYITGISNIVFGSILIGCSLISLGIVYCQQKRQGNNQNTPYNPPVPGSYPTQPTAYPANPGSYPQTLQGQNPYVYPAPPPYTVQQVNPTSSTSQPLSAASFSYQNPAGVSDMSDMHYPIGFQAPGDLGHQKAAGELQDMKDIPPPYSP